jgi:hypothetical protein
MLYPTILVRGRLSNKRFFFSSVRFPSRVLPKEASKEILAPAETLEYHPAFECCLNIAL